MCVCVCVCVVCVCLCVRVYVRVCRGASDSGPSKKRESLYKQFPWH